MWLPERDLIEKIIGCTYTADHARDTGFLEKVYREIDGQSVTLSRKFRI